MKQTFFFLACFCFSWDCHCTDQAEFFKTKVIKDSYNSPKLEQLETLDHKSCLFHCAKRSECRKVLYCKNIESFSCLLYDEGEHCVTKTGNEIDCKCYRKLYSCNETDCSCPKGFYGDKCRSVVKDCHEARDREFDTGKKKLVFIQPTLSTPPFEVPCHSGSARIEFRQIGGVFEINFNRTLEEYVEGFGNRETEFWIGLEKMRAIIGSGESDELKISFWVENYSDSDNQKHAYYKQIYIGNKTTGYAFSSSEFVGTESNVADIMLDSNTSALGQPFSTLDTDSTGYDCPARFGGGWWYANDPDCSLANINGPRSAFSYNGIVNIIEIQIQLS